MSTVALLGWTILAGATAADAPLNQLGVILLFVVGLGLMFTEMLLPGIVFGLCGFGCVVAAIFFAFQLSGTLGWVFVVLAAASIPTFLLFWTKVVGKYFAIKETQKDFVGTESGMHELMGQEGVTLTTLRPAGMARFGDKKVDVIADGEIIEKDTRVRVMEVKGNRVVVRSVRA